jgi:4,5-DOPA dioxygenase extradiol
MLPLNKLALTALISLVIALSITTFTNLAPPSFLKNVTTLFKQTRIMATQATQRTPVYFVSHGGPTTMFQKDHAVYPRLEAMGKEITEKVKPKAIVVFSAHWQAERPNTIEVNVSEQEPLLYDFYGFPKHFYSEKFPNNGSTEVAERVIELLGEAGIQTQKEERGLDHGVFVPFKIMFNPEENPVNVPIVQVSLFDNDRDAAKHIKLGRAVEKLRDENVLIICSGMAVHNLRDLRLTMMNPSIDALPYAKSFDAALKEAVETAPGDERVENMVNLLRRPDGRQAHPTFEHLLPIHIAVGAAGNDSGKQLWTLPEGSMSWAQYKFGEVEA